MIIQPFGCTAIIDVVLVLLCMIIYMLYAGGYQGFGGMLCVFFACFLFCSFFTKFKNTAGDTVIS